MNEILNKILDGCPFRVKYKDKTPNPGYCKVLSIDWEYKKMTVTNGSVMLFPLFDEVEIVKGDD